LQEVIDPTSEHFPLAKKVLLEACQSARKQLDPLYPYRAIEETIARLAKLEDIKSTDKKLMDTMYKEIETFLRQEFRKRVPWNDWSRAM
jgi:hypothetical protein